MATRPPPPLPSRQQATQQPNDALLAAFLARSHAECPNPAALAHTPTSLRLLARMRAWKNVIMVADALRRHGNGSDGFRFWCDDNVYAGKCADFSSPPLAESGTVLLWRVPRGSLGSP